MKQISKREAFAMRELGLTEYICRSKSKNPKYYVVETFVAEKALEKFRKSIIVETVGNLK